MAVSRVPATLDRLEVVALAAVTAPTRVFRGPFVTGDPGNALFIGYDGDPVGDFRSVNTTTEWAGIGAKARTEQFDVFCAVTVLSGEANVKAATDTTYAIYEEFAGAVRSDPDLNQAPPYVAAPTVGELFTMPHPTGLQVRLSFLVQVKTRI